MSTLDRPARELEIQGKEAVKHRQAIFHGQTRSSSSTSKHIVKTAINHQVKNPDPAASDSESPSPSPELDPPSLLRYLCFLLFNFDSDES